MYPYISYYMNYDIIITDIIKFKGIIGDQQARRKVVNSGGGAKQPTRKIFCGEKLNPIKYS